MEAVGSSILSMSTCLDIELTPPRKSIITGIFSLGIFVVSRFPCASFF